MFIRADKGLRTFCGYSVASAHEGVAVFQRASTLQLSPFPCFLEQDILCTNAFRISHDTSNRTLPAAASKCKNTSRRIFQFVDFPFSCFRDLIKRVPKGAAHPLFQYLMDLPRCQKKVASCIMSSEALSVFILFQRHLI